jgi:membrane-associated phospholipid phosphatase
MPWAELLFRGISELGSDFFYMILIAVGFWVVDKRAAILTAFVLLASSTSNYLLKITFKVPRPPTTNWVSGVLASNYSLPSGHAQNSMTVWGWLGIKIKTWWLRTLSVVLIGLIGISRVYLGVHWLGDVVAGWLVGCIILIVLWKLEEPMRSIISRYNTNLIYLGFVIFGLCAIILTEFLSPVRIEGLEANFAPNGGFIVGLGIGLILEKKYVNFDTTLTNGEKWRATLRVVLGFVLVFTTGVSLSYMLPRNIYWLCATQYALLTIVVIFIWPFLFKKFSL